MIIAAAAGILLMMTFLVGWRGKGNPESMLCRNQDQLHSAGVQGQAGFAMTLRVNPTSRFFLW